jgi:hypothetical protein
MTNKKSDSNPPAAVTNHLTSPNAASPLFSSSTAPFSSFAAAMEAYKNFPSVFASNPASLAAFFPGYSSPSPFTPSGVFPPYPAPHHQFDSMAALRASMAASSYLMAYNSQQHRLKGDSSVSPCRDPFCAGCLAGGNSRPFVCNWVNAGDVPSYCGKYFASSEELLAHLRTHTTASSSVTTGTATPDNGNNDPLAAYRASLLLAQQTSSKYGLYPPVVAATSQVTNHGNNNKSSTASSATNNTTTSSTSPFYSPMFQTPSMMASALGSGPGALSMAHLAAMYPHLQPTPLSSLFASPRL